MTTTAPAAKPVATQIFVNLPVKDLQRSVAFFTALGFGFEPKFTDENATCMIIGENIFAMLLVETFFKTFTDKDIADTRTHVEALIALTLPSREAVDKMIVDALAGGGKSPRPALDHGFMYYRDFEDLDGHTWEVLHMVPEQAE